jgi:CheY-like chemotaxis protein
MFTIKRRVVLVDDNKDGVDMLSYLLNDAGIETQIAYDGCTGIDLLLRWPAHIVFLDIQMPRMNGYETAIAMHALPGLAHLPIVAMSGWDGIGTPQLSEAANFAHRLTKPVVLKDVLDAIHHWGVSLNTIHA